MTKKLISTGSPFEREFGYSRAVKMGNFVHVAGTTGYDYETMIMPDSVGEQAQNCIDTIQSALKEADASLSDVVRVTYYLTDSSYMDEIIPVMGAAFGEIRPAATLVICGLIKPEMKIEIEVTAQLS